MATEPSVETICELCGKKYSTKGRELYKKEHPISYGFKYSDGVCDNCHQMGLEE